MAEVYAVELEDKRGEKLYVAVLYIPPHAGACTNQEYDQLIGETLEGCRTLS